MLFPWIIKLHYYLQTSKYICFAYKNTSIWITQAMIPRHFKLWQKNCWWSQFLWTILVMKSFSECCQILSKNWTSKFSCNKGILLCSRMIQRETSFMYTCSSNYTSFVINLFHFYWYIHIEHKWLRWARLVLDSSKYFQNHVVAQVNDCLCLNANGIRIFGAEFLSFAFLVFRLSFYLINTIFWYVFQKAVINNHFIHPFMFCCWELCCSNNDSVGPFVCVLTFSQTS